MTTDRYGHATVVIRNKILVMGGQSRRNSKLNSVEFYDPERNEWNHVAPMLEARENFQAGTVNDFVYVFGGKLHFPIRKLLLTSVERYSIENNSWTKVTNFFSRIRFMWYSMND